MKKIKKREPCGCGKIKMLLNNAKIPDYIRENPLADLARIYFCKHCEEYATYHLTRKQMENKKL